MKIISNNTFLISLFLLTFLWSSDGSTRMEPASWFRFINSTDFVVKGEVFSAKQVKDKWGSPYVKLGLKVEATIVVNDQSIKPDEKIDIYIGGHTNPINVGNEGYFFITQTFGKWFVLDGDIGAWQLKKTVAIDPNGEVYNFRTAPNVFEFPFSILRDPPTILRQKLRYIDYPVDDETIVEKIFFTEVGLLNYFNSEPCRFDEITSSKIDKNIKAYLTTKHPKATKEYLERIDQTEFLSFKDMGETCAFKELENETRDYFLMVLVDKKTNLIFDDIGVERRGSWEKRIRNQNLWESYKSGFDSLE